MPWKRAKAFVLRLLECEQRSFLPVVRSAVAAAWLPQTAPSCGHGSAVASGEPRDAFATCVRWD